MISTADFYIDAEEHLEEKLGRKPTWEEIKAEVQDRVERFAYFSELTMELKLENQIGEKDEHSSTP